MDMIRILALADTHLGFDYPFKPRVERRRRGPDFFANFDRALEPALKGEVDLIVHGGDVFYRSKIPGKLVDMVFTRFHRVADRGVPVYIVPGNHERSRIPYRLLAEHPNIHFFDLPISYVFQKNGFAIALAGFPAVRKDVRSKFPEVLNQTSWQETGAAGTILCMHQSVDGATTGPHHYTFRRKPDVVDVHDIPSSFLAVITGHMHRQQVIRQDLAGRSLSFPVYYPGSVERTSFAEKNEIKGYILIDIRRDGAGNAMLDTAEFRQLPVRSMVDLEFDTAVIKTEAFEPWLKDHLSAISEDSIVRLCLKGQLDERLLQLITAKSLRSRAPVTMNIVLKWKGSTG